MDEVEPRGSLDVVVLALGLAGLVGGAALHAAGSPDAGDAVWAAATAVGLVVATWWLVASLREGRLGVDLISVLALGGALAVDEVLAGTVITIMLASGRTLESRAARRAARELTALRARAPRVVHRYVDGELTEPGIDEVAVGDLLMVQPGEVVPVDGVVVGSAAVLDESALTGEPLPVERPVGEPIRSGSANAGGSFDLRATATAAESTYAGIVKLADEARASSSPFVRMADRFAVGFVAVSIALAGLAWLLSGDPARAVAVLVVATPCPLILAAPVAILSGVAGAARRGVVMKGGDALERLADGQVLLFDKTGTVTQGEPTVSTVVTDGSIDGDEVLRLAASVDQASPHVLALAVVRAARQRDLPLELATGVEEVPGRGIEGDVGDRRVAVGRWSWLLPDAAPRWARSVSRSADLDGALTMLVRVDGQVVGAIILRDPVRPDAARTIRDLRHAGIERTIMVTGDRADVAETIGAILGVDQVLAERSPAEKVEAVQAESRRRRTIMVGDGINDAPALSAARVGVAIGARGATVSSEAADVVLVVDRLDRLADAFAIARHARRIARQSVLVGIGLSALAMVVAAFGYLPAAWGALLQEVIDVAVITNALRALRRPSALAELEAGDAAVVDRFTDEHTSLRPDLDRIRRAGDAIGVLPEAEALAAARAVHGFLATEVLPHELAEDAMLYPVVDRVLGGSDATAAMSRAHTEIAHHIRRLGRLLDAIDVETGGGEAADPEDQVELRRSLYALHAILELHFAQEDEGYLVPFGARAGGGVGGGGGQTPL